MAAPAVTTKQTLPTTEEACPKSFAADDEDFPVIDFSRYERQPDVVATEIFDAASRWGFLVIKGHGIPSQDIDAMFELSKDFFSQPPDVKQEKWLNLQGQGYDYKESVIGVHEACCFGNVANSTLTSPNFAAWWTPAKRQRIDAFRRQCQAVSTRLFAAFALAMGLPTDFFAAAHDPDKLPGNALRLIRYHALAAPPTHDFPRLCAHTDWGTMTFLFARAPGLEVRRPRDDGWVMAPVLGGEGEDSIVVNVADGLALWSGGALKSTRHRLTWDTVPWDRERYSMAYFVNANADAPIKVLQRKESSFVEAPTSGLATFGDYQAVRIKLIEKHDTHLAAEDLEVDPKLLEMVRSMGIALAPGLTEEE